MRVIVGDAGFAWINPASGSIPPACEALRSDSMPCPAEVAAEFRPARFFN